MVNENELCLAFDKYVFSFGNIYTAFCTSAQSPVEKDLFFRTFISYYLEMSQHKNDVLNSVNIIKVNLATRKW